MSDKYKELIVDQQCKIKELEEEIKIQDNLIKEYMAMLNKIEGPGLLMDAVGRKLLLDLAEKDKLKKGEKEEMKKVAEKEKLIRCMDCANYPNMCGYFSTDKSYIRKMHTCRYVDEKQQGFKPAEEMSLKDTIYQFGMYLRGSGKNTELYNRIMYFLKGVK